MARRLRKSFFKRSHKVIVTLTVREILDEHIHLRFSLRSGSTRN